MDRLKSSNISFKCLLGLSGLSLILQIVATAIPNWLSVEIGKFKITSGLWSSCTSFDDTAKVCTSIKEVLDYVKACQAFAILCVLLIVLEIFFLGFYIFRLEFNENSAKNLVLITLISETLCGIICCGIYAGKSPESAKKLSAGFYLSVVTIIFLFISSIVSWFSFE